MTEFDWDAWRAAYQTTTYSVQQDFHAEVWKAYPEQRHFDAELVGFVINETQPADVLELGGWDGELAEEILKRCPSVRRWRNVELCREAAEAGRDRYPNYEVLVLPDWYWSRVWTTDLFVASHVIEHLTAEHLDLVVGATHADYLFFDAPLNDAPSDWQGFTGTHILGVGWDGVTEICSRHGYELMTALNHDTSPGSGDRARGCLYAHMGAG